MKVIVTGISGGLGRLIAQSLVERGHEVVGIDSRAWSKAPAGVKVVVADLRKRPAEDVFRTVRPDALVHTSAVSHLQLGNSMRHRQSLGGTKAAIDHCVAHGVRRAIFLGRHTFYGATPESPLYHTEDEPPMGSENYTELADLVAADLFAGSALWRYDDLETVVLRMCYTLGPARHGTLAHYLAGPRVPTVLGFDPLFQLMHELDAVDAVVHAVEKPIRGVFNVAGPAPLPLSAVIEQAGRRRLRIAEKLWPVASGKFGLPHLSAGAVNHIKYSIVVDGSAFAKATGFTTRATTYDTLKSFRQAFPVR